MKSEKRIIVSKTGTNTVTAPDYGDAWINRLALVLAVMREMEADELAATLTFVNSKFTLR